MAVKAQTKDTPDLDKIDIQDPVRPIDTSKVHFIAIEKEAGFPGGMDKFYQYLYNNIKIPQIDSSSNYKVKVQFTVGGDGRIMRVEILQTNASDIINREILDVFIKSPRWSMAIQNGKAVKQSFDLDLDLRPKKN